MSDNEEGSRPPPLPGGEGYGPFDQPGWRPYCLVCPTMTRMQPRPYGWECGFCGNRIGRDLRRHLDVDHT